MRYELTDHEWTAIKPMLPNKPRGVPRVNDRRVLNGIFWVLRRFGADIATAAGPIIDDDGLPEPLRQPLADQAREEITRTARREANHDAHRSRRIGLRACNTRYHQERDGACRGHMQCSTARKLHGLPHTSMSYRNLRKRQSNRFIRPLRHKGVAIHIDPESCAVVREGQRAIEKCLDNLGRQ
jgi:hypothetical protein